MPVYEITITRASETTLYLAVPPDWPRRTLTLADIERAVAESISQHEWSEPAITDWYVVGVAQESDAETYRVANWRSPQTATAQATRPGETK